MASRQGPHWDIINKRGRWERLQIELYNDGEQKTWPSKPYRTSSDERYLITLGTAWATELGVQEPGKTDPEAHVRATFAIPTPATQNPTEWKSWLLISHAGVNYYVNSLPSGFALFEMAQPNGTQTYKRLFGHPSGRYYDSILRFQPHFLWLMSGMEGNCECHLCGNFKREAPVRRRMRYAIAETKPLVAREAKIPFHSYESDASSRSQSLAGRGTTGTSTRPQRQLKAAGAPYAQDEEGTENVYKSQLRTLGTHKESNKGIEDDILEHKSIDWRAEHSWIPPNIHDWAGIDLVQQTLTAIEHQHSFVPRVGELVLFCPHFREGHYLMLDEQTKAYKFYSFEQKCFNGFPTWRAGLVAAIPSETAQDGPVDFPDIQDVPKKHNSLNIGGFRVETFPDPNNEHDKSASKQFGYFPLRSIRPLTHWQMLLRGVPRLEWHPSIERALTCMTSISLLEKFYFKGDWEKDKYGVKKAHASIRCKGVYIGAELITIGDSVRIMPADKEQGCTDVLVVESIRLHLRDIQPEHFLPETPQLSTQSYITLVGKAYTTDKARSVQRAALPSSSLVTMTVEEAKTIFRPVGSALYGPWCSLHAPHHRYEISHDQILGRMHEGAAVQLWTGLLQRKPIHGEKHAKPNLSYDLKGVQEGRKYATQADERLEESNEEPLLWFWADTRAEALDVQTINGVEVGRYDKVRDETTLGLWRMQLNLFNGIPLDSISSKFTSFAGLDLPLDDKRTGIPGRKPGSKLINGRIYQAGELPPGYDKPLGANQSVGGREISVQLTPSKQKGSQLAGAAVVSTDEEDGDEDVYQDAREDWGFAVDGTSVESAIRYTSPTPRRQQQPKKPKTKAEIMENAAEEESFSEDDFEYRFARGGTEESEGGDYNPQA